MDDRMKKLLKNAAKCFRNCFSPFCHEELVKQSVTSDEAYDLSMRVASAVEFMLANPDQHQDWVMAKIAKKIKQHVSPVMGQAVEDQIKRQQILRKIQTAKL